MAGSASSSMKYERGSFSLKIAVSGFGVSILSMTANSSRLTITTPDGGLIARLNVAATSAEVNGVPSWNLTPSRRLKV